MPTDILPVTHRDNITLDGQTDDWAGAPLITVDTQDDVLPPDPTVGWTGPENLSAQASLAWDDENLYLLVRVTDDVHATPNVQSVGFWQSDSMQIAFDMMNDGAGDAGFGDDDREYGVVIDEQDAHIFQTWPATEHPNFRAAGQRVGSATIYEMAFPWSELGRDPQPGMVFSFNFILNENDGTGRKYWMGLTPGIGEGKRPNDYRDFYLHE